MDDLYVCCVDSVMSSKDTALSVCFLLSPHHSLVSNEIFIKRMIFAGKEGDNSCKQSALG